MVLHFLFSKKIDINTPNIRSRACVPFSSLFFYLFFLFFLFFNWIWVDMVYIIEFA